MNDNLFYNSLLLLIINYSILSGNTNNVFEINSGSGIVSVLDNSTIDYEDITQYIL